MKIYLDGALQAATNTQAGAINSSEAITLGRREWNSDSYFDGILDEARASSTNRSTNWIKFEWANINEADNELSWGDEETPSGETSIKSIDGLAKASVKSFNGLAIASVKSINGLE